MAVEVFRKLYRESQNSGFFSFKKLNDQICLLSPKLNGKQTISYQDSEQKIFSEAKSAIIKNFCLNPDVSTIDDFNVTILNDFMNFLNDDEFSDKTLAHSFFLLHGSKTDLSNVKNPKIILTDLFYNFSSINTNISINEFSYLNSIFESLVNSENVTKTINSIIHEAIAENDKVSYDYKRLKLIFFNSNFDSLSGFSGKDRIYINTRPLSKIKSNRVYSEKANETAIKLEFTRVYLHETSHVVLRHQVGNLNLSSPFLKNESKTIRKNLPECGVEIEKRIFKEVIDWNSSINNRYDLPYCEQFLSNILSDKIDNFDIEKARVVLIPESEILKASFSMTYRPYPYFF
ncbi:unnamed protein product [Brachionus calyciflorus]|uniref:Uncharacterized protein n=1 Tax=Brachionus calyciflorus TaxID=104777 RepID=A0A813U9S7_9BILA|nr:unnamed protein product [Brachionus calyciflorus]